MCRHMCRYMPTHVRPLKLPKNSTHPRRTKRVTPCFDSCTLPLFAACVNCWHIICRTGDGVAVDLAEAARWFRPAAEKGLNSAQGHLGYLLLTGQGVNQDGVEGIKWLRLGGGAGDTAAMYLLQQIPLSTPGMRVEVTGLTSEAGQVGRFTLEGPMTRCCTWQMLLSHRCLWRSCTRTIAR